MNLKDLQSINNDSPIGCNIRRSHWEDGKSIPFTLSDLMRLHPTEWAADNWEVYRPGAVKMDISKIPDLEPYKNEILELRERVKSLSEAIKNISDISADQLVAIAST